jgi:small subunit ribosomal protein S9
MDILAKAVGRRKEAVAQVQILKGTGQFIINNKPAQEYLQNDTCSLISVKAPFDILLMSTSKKAQQNSAINKDNGNLNSNATPLNIDTIVKVKGGGLMGQSEAIRLGIARAICSLSANETSDLTQNGAISVDSLTQQNDGLTAATKEGLDGSNATELEGSSPLDVRKQLKDKGYLTQDSRVKERRKYGLKKARKASQYHKR